MPRVFTFGETIYDIIFRDEKPVAASAGGAMLNTSVSLGRSGVEVSLISELGNDRIGRIILDFLQENHVGTDHMFVSPDAKTPISVAMLDEIGNAGYDFYKIIPDERLPKDLPAPSNGDYILFGSFYSLDEGIRDKLTGFLRHASRSGALVIYDPNIRINHLKEIGDQIDKIFVNISLSDIVRGSDEDFINLFGSTDADEIYQTISAHGCSYLIITRGSEGVDLFTPHGRSRFSVPSIEPVSTIGAGDAFNAGLIFGLLEENAGMKGLDGIDKKTWEEVIAEGIRFSQDTCLGFENFISVRFGEMVRDTARRDENIN